MTETGIHPNVSLEKAGIRHTEQNIIKHFSNLFSISFAKSHNFKGAWYNFAFLKPTKELREKYRFQNEMLLITTAYENFDTRTFDYVDRLMFEYQNRLDKLCVILISGDNKIKTKISSLAQQNPETRIIIPFSYVDFFKTEPQSLIQQRLKEFFYGRDLFAFESPLQNDAYFYGRTETVQFFYDKYKSGENSGLFGLRKIGKTSVLYALKRYLSLRGENSVFIDCQEPSFHKRRWYECLEFIVNQLVLELSNSGIENLNIKLNTNYTEKDASIYFEEDLKKIYNSNNKNRILIIFDEIENITFDISPTEHWNKETDFILFWQSIRAIYQKNQGLFSFIIAGVNPKTIETGLINSFDNPIYRMITPTYLKLFNHSNVSDMVKNIGNYMGLDFDEEIFTFLTDDFGGHPFLIRQICSRIHQETSTKRPIKVSKLYYKENLNNFNKFKEAVSFEIENLSAFMRKLSQIVSYKNRLKLTKLRKIYQIKSKYQMIKQNKSSFKRRGVKLIKSLNQMKERNIASRNASIELSKKVNDMIIENSSAPNLNEAKKLLQQRKVKEAFLLVTKSIKEHNEKLLESKSKSKRKEKVKTEVSINDSKNTGNTVNLEQEINQKAQIQKKH